MQVNKQASKGKGPARSEHVKSVSGVRTEPLAGRDTLQTRGAFSSMASVTAFGAGRMLRNADGKVGRREPSPPMM